MRGVTVTKYVGTPYFSKEKKPMCATNPMFETEGQGPSAFRHHPPFRFSLFLQLFWRRLGAICLHCNDSSLLSNKPKQHPRRRQNRGEKATPGLESLQGDLVNHVRFCRSKIRDLLGLQRSQKVSKPNHLQGDHSGCAKPPVDIKTKVMF